MAAVAGSSILSALSAIWVPCVATAVALSMLLSLRPNTPWTAPLRELERAVIIDGNWLLTSS